MRSVASALAAAALVGSTTHTQAPRQQPPVFRSGVDVVQLDVSVVDKDRRPVRGLTRDEFTVLEDGVVQPIVAFEAIDIADPPPPPAACAFANPGLRAANVRYELPLTLLGPGAHLLTVAVTQGSTLIRRDVRFSVR